MKHLLFLLLAAFSLTTKADPISPEKALELSKRFISQDETQVLQLSAKRSGKFDGISAAKGSTADTSAPYYIISRGKGLGFVIVSGDDCLPEILGIVDHGDYDENDMPESFRDWLQYRADQVEYAQANGINTPYVAAAVPEDRVDVPFLLQTLWHQASPYNDRCPKLTTTGNRAATGCVATASAQIAYYWRRDIANATKYDTPTYSYGAAPALAENVIKKGTPLKWDLMLKRYSNSEPQEFRDAVATLVATVGMSGYLEYGESTGGQIGDMPKVFSGQFGLNGGTCLYKSYDSGLVVTEARWSELLYNQLIQGRPVLYCGYNNSNGGHAVVCDGYNAQTGFFHINFGWGDSYNGYFSLEDGVAGWGFNDSWTGCVYDIYPKTTNASVEMEMPEHLFKGIDTPFGVHLTNQSTLPIKGVYMFVQTRSEAPTKLSTSKAVYLTQIPVDEQVDFKLSAKVTTKAKYYVFLTDEKLNVLYKGQIASEDSSADLYFKDLTLNSSSEVEVMNGEVYQVVYNTSTSVNATLCNKSGKPYYGGLRLSLSQYDTEAGEWKGIGTATAISTFEAETDGIAKINIQSTSLPLATGRYYRAVLSDSITSSKDKVQNVSDEGNVVRFVMKSKDMAVVSFNDRVLKLKGHFDPTVFNSVSFAGKSTYKTAVAYDLTDCEGVSSVMQEVNPNALYYVSSNSKAEGNNVVKDGRVSRLVLTPGYDFVPQGSFSVDSVIINNSAVTSAQWCMITPPAKVNVPVGMAAREITGHTSTSYGLLGKLKDVTVLEAGKTYLLMTSSARNNTLRGGASEIAATPVENIDATVIGTYTSVTTADKALVLQMRTDGVQYLQTTPAGTAVEALRGYVADNKAQTIRTYNAIAADKNYIALANEIVKASLLFEKYSAKATPDALSLLDKEIRDAEKVFSYRETDASTEAVVAAYEHLDSVCTLFCNVMPAKVLVNTDCTSAIVNPSFEKGSTAGWTVGSTTAAKAYNGTAANAYRGVGLDGSYLLRNLNTSDSTSVALSQTVKSLTPGIYRLTAKVGTSAGRCVTLFAGNDSVTVPAHQYGNLYLSETVIDDILVLADKDSDTGSLNIGINAGDWYKADDFRLTLVHTLNSGVKGDVNGDGKVTVQDANIIVNSASHSINDAKNIINTYLGE